MYFPRTRVESALCHAILNFVFLCSFVRSFRTVLTFVLNRADLKSFIYSSVVNNGKCEEAF